MTYRLRPQAEADIEAIVLFIAEDNPTAAPQWYEEIHPRCRLLGDTPSIGVAQPQVTPDLRTFPVGNYLLLYREIA